MRRQGEFEHIVIHIEAVPNVVFFLLHLLKAQMLVDSDDIVILPIYVSGGFLEKLSSSFFRADMVCFILEPDQMLEKHLIARSASGSP